MNRWAKKNLPSRLCNNIHNRRVNKQSIINYLLTKVEGVSLPYNVFFYIYFFLTNLNHCAGMYINNINNNVIIYMITILYDKYVI